MKSRIWNIIIVISFVCFAQEKQSAKAFVESLYNTFQENAVTFSFNGAAADSIFSKEFLALIRLDQKLADGEAGYLDWNPLCDCQDAEGMSVKSIRKLPGSTMDTVAIEVILNFKTEKKAIHLDIVKCNDKWVIGNIKHEKVGDLYNYLKKNLAE